MILTISFLNNPHPLGSCSSSTVLSDTKYFESKLLLPMNLHLRHCNVPLHRCFNNAVSKWRSIFYCFCIVHWGGGGGGGVKFVEYLSVFVWGDGGLSLGYIWGWGKFGDCLAMLGLKNSWFEEFRLC